jgi:hypothetical protein
MNREMGFSLPLITIHLYNSIKQSHQRIKRAIKTIMYRS